MSEIHRFDSTLKDTSLKNFINQDNSPTLRIEKQRTL